MVHADTKQTTRMHTMIILTDNDANSTITFRITKKIVRIDIEQQ